MRLIRYSNEQKINKSVITIGNFDGLHLGHQALINRLLKISSEKDLPCVVMSFYPLPNAYFNPDHPHQIMTFQAKYLALMQMGVDYFACQRFNSRFRMQSADEFVDQCLKKSLGVEHLIVGHDFRFGHGAKGNIELLEKKSKDLGFELEVFPEFQLENQKVSSTQVREALLKGDMKRVQVLLGRPFSIIARVQPGKAKGRTLGFPTANLSISERYVLINGVYTCMATVGNKRYPAVTNVGYQPTLNGQKKRVEVHLLDFEGDLYGQKIQVEFLKKIRDEKKFKSLSELCDAIKHDIIQAREFFSDMTQNWMHLAQC